ncbi:MAGUK p55 subfamily member 5-a [Plakobranchus ocellatus]|uniref:MAGUK p55 subfamily member 5-a n=1 Tax=Plakobranchus ocellatus TaxID=259542 RepID=A0AAV4CS25_9GAST|nr:MAGUK p55 subfamily member 5-a [Plakobranchus ocellatus]
MVQGPHTKVNKSFSVRMKSTLTKRGVHVKTSGYRVVHVLGSLRPLSSSRSAPTASSMAGQTTPTDPPNNDSTSRSGSNERVETNTSVESQQTQPMGLVGMAIALPPPTITELRLELDTFITRLGPDFKIVYCEPIINDLVDLHVDDVTDRLLYDLCHPADLKSLQRSHIDILRKGQALTDYYRLMGRNGGFVWIQTCATTLLNNKSSPDDQSILAINYVVSGIEAASTPLDLWQLTGDVASVMSSSCDSAARREKLQELKASGSPRQLPSYQKGQLKKNKRENPAGAAKANTVKAGNTNNSRIKHSRSNETLLHSSPYFSKIHSSDEASNDESELSTEQNIDTLESNSHKKRKICKPKKRAKSSEQASSDVMIRKEVDSGGGPGGGGEGGGGGGGREGGGGNDSGMAEPIEKALNLTRHDNKTREFGSSCNVAVSSPHVMSSKLGQHENGNSVSYNRRHEDNQESAESVSISPSTHAALTPEDLSMKKTQLSTTDTFGYCEMLPGRNIIQHSSFSSHNSGKNQSSSLSRHAFSSSSSDMKHQAPVKALDLNSKSNSSLLVANQPHENTTCERGSSVQDLEAAMNRHLPDASLQVTNSGNEDLALTGGVSSSLSSSLHTGGTPSLAHSSSTPCLPSLPSTSDASSYDPSASSTLTGSAWLTPPRVTGTEMLTASNFLRSLYAASTRESVIKTGGSSGGVNAEGVTSTESRTPFMNPNLPPSTLLTPPEPDPVTYKTQSRAKEVKDDATKSIYPCRDSEAFSSRAVLNNYPHQFILQSDNYTIRDRTGHKDFYPSSSFLSFRDYQSNPHHHHYFHITSHNPPYTEYSHQQHEQNLPNHFGHLNQNFNNSSLLPANASAPAHKSPTIYSTSTALPSSPYKDAIPTFNIPSLMSPTTPGPFLSGPASDEAVKGRTLHEAFPHTQYSLNFSPAPPSPSSSHQLQQQHHHHHHHHQQQQVDSLSMTPPASASPDPNKIPPPANHCVSDPGYPTATNSQMGSDNNIGSFPYQYHYSTSLSKNSSEGVIKGTVYGVTSPSMGPLMDVNPLASGTGQYEACPRPVLPWY